MLFLTPPFLWIQAQFSSENVQQTETIASLRIHVERAIRRIKENHFFYSDVPMNALDSINQIYTGACLLTNFQEALWFLTQMGVSVNWIILVIITVITTVITFYERCACDKDLVFRITRYLAMFMREAYYNCVQHSFHVISLSETKIKSNCDLTSNIAIEGYDFVSKQL